MREPQNTPKVVDPWRLDELDNGYGSFDVTAVIGTVSITPDGTRPAHVEAFEMIARHDAEGHYTFPMRDGRLVHVTVEYEPRENT